MAGAQVTIMANQVEGQRIGYQAISLTHFNDTSEPQLAAGSLVEVGGALFEFAGLESITGWAGIAISTDAYIKLTVSGASVTASFTIAAPTWDTAKQGWYDGAERYIGGLYKDGSGNYALKWLYDPADLNEMLRSGNTRPLLEIEIQIGDWNMDATSFVAVNHGLASHKKVRHISAIIRDDIEGSYYPAASMPNGDAGQTPSWGIQACSSTQILLWRETGGAFDDVLFDSTSYNRGWIYFKIRA